MRRRGLTTASVLEGLRKSRHRQVPGAGRHRPGPASEQRFNPVGDQGSSVLRTQKNYPTYSGLGPTIGLSDLPRPRRVTEAAAPHPQGCLAHGIAGTLWGSSSEPLPCRGPSKRIASSASVGAGGRPGPRGPAAAPTPLLTPLPCSCLSPSA